MLHTRAAQSGASRLNRSASLSETNTLASNAAATVRSYCNKVRASRRYTQLSGQRRDSAYCRHLSESMSTKSITRRRPAAGSTYWAIGPENARTRSLGRSRRERREMAFNAQRPQRIDVAPVVGVVDEGAEMDAIIAAELLEQVIRAQLIALVGRIRYAMGKKEQLLHRSSQLLDDVRADQPRHTERQSLPDVDEALVFGIERIHVGDAVRLHQHVFVMERLGFEAPVLFETLGIGVAFAAAVIEDAYDALGCAPHQVPVHEVVALHFAGERGAAAVVWQHFVTKIKTHLARHQPARLCDGEHLAVCAVHFALQREVFAGKYLRAEVVHALRIGVVKACDAGVNLAGETGLAALAHHRALLARDGEHVLFRIGVDLLAEGDVKIVFARPVAVARCAIAEFEVIDAALARQLDCRRLKRAGRLGVDRGHAAVHAERQRAQLMTEQAAANLTERQYAFDDAVTLRIEKIAAMPEGAFEHAGPAGAMKESGLRACDHEGVPPIGIGRGQALDETRG